MRTVMIYDTPFPPTHKAGRFEFAWKVIKEAANDNEDPELKNSFNRSMSNPSIKKDLMAFVCYFFFQDCF